MDGWQDFDAWCCTKGIEPLELPAYRYYNLVLYKLREGLDEEGLNMLERNLESFDSFRNPLYDLRTIVVDRKTASRSAPTAPRKEAYRYVPSWWRGDDANARVALNTMKSLPK